MYIPQNFEVTEREKALGFVKSNAFGQLISTVKNRLFSSHIPFLVSEEGKSLLCHVAKNNPQWQEIETHEALVTFQGAHGYISPSWYDSPGVPTWNYQVVHIYGRAELITDVDKLKSMVNELTNIYEASLESPWIPEYKESMLNSIIGIEVKITDVQCKFKLSQNRPEVDRRKVIDKLNERNSVQLSEAMKNEL